MREASGDLWRIPADARCITTNGVVKSNGSRPSTLVMGAGVAAQAATKYPTLPQIWGAKVLASGNAVYHAAFETNNLVSFPTKHDYREKSSLPLIQLSCEQLMSLIDQMGWRDVVLPRPGCGLGGLHWESQVKPAIETRLDNRVIVITHARRLSPTDVRRM